MAEAQKKPFYSVGCGNLQSNVLIAHLRRKGVKTVLDVRETPHSQKRPWFNKRRISKDFSKAKIVYTWVGDKLGASSWNSDRSRNELQVLMRTSRGPICLLGLRADPKEGHRIHIAQYLHCENIYTIQHLIVKSAFKITCEDHSEVWKEISDTESGQYQTLCDTLSIESKSADTIPDFNKKVSFAVHIDPYTALFWKRDFQPDNTNIIQEIGNLKFTRPLRQIISSTGVRQEFQEHHSEIWLSNEYNRSDRRRVGSAFFPAEPIPQFLNSYFERLHRLTGCMFNGLQIYREPCGPHPKDGPHTWSTEHGFGKRPVIAMISFGFQRSFRLHSTNSNCVIDVPLANGSLLVLGGSIKENWLYAFPRDNRHANSDRFLLVFQMYKYESLKI